MAGVRNDPLWLLSFQEEYVHVFVCLIGGLCSMEAAHCASST